MAHKKAPATLIDDVSVKFHQHELERKRLLDGQRGYTGRESAPLECTIGGEGDLLSLDLSEGPEDLDDLAGEELTNGGGVGGQLGFFSAGSGDACC